jgi:hypothetical protein
MLAVCYGAKGGQGTTTVAAALAITDTGPDLMVIDACGDLPAALGVPEPGGPGLAGLLTSDAAIDADTVAAMAERVGVGANLVPVGGALRGLPYERWVSLAGVLRDDRRRWLVDAGTGPATVLAMHTPKALLVTTNCFLALRRAQTHPVRPSGVVLVRDPARSIGEQDVAGVVDAPVVAVVERDPRVAVATDAGLLVGQLPESLRRPLAAVGEGIW